jgi:hypothetical protein
MSSAQAMISPEIAPTNRKSMEVNKAKPQIVDTGATFYREVAPRIFLQKCLYSVGIRLPGPRS